MTMPNWLSGFGIGKSITAKSLVPKVAPWMGKATPLLAAAATGTWLGDTARRAFGGNDPYYASPYSSFNPLDWGKPDPTLFNRQQGGGELSPYAQNVFATKGKEAGVTPTPEATFATGAMATNQANLQAYAKKQADAQKKAQDALDLLANKGKPSAFPAEPPPPGYRWVFDSQAMNYVLEPDPNAAGMSPYQKEDIRLKQEAAARDLLMSDYQRSSEERARQQAQQAQANELWQQQWLQNQAAQKQVGEQSQQALQQQQWQQQFQWEQQRAEAQQAEKERQYRSQLAANPRSWLEYASYTGQAPVIQPWMLPLMPQQYAGQVAGNQIPGWSGGSTMANLPGLTTPSMQYLARMGPNATQQWLGYNQAQGGITPEETQFRVQSMAPPGGRNYGLTWGR